MTTAARLKGFETLGKIDRKSGLGCGDTMRIGVAERNAYMRGFTGRRTKAASRGRNCESQTRRAGA